MHKPKNTLFSYVLMGLIGCVMLYAAMGNAFGNLLASVICGIAGAILIICAGLVIWQGYLRKEEPKDGGNKDE